MRFELKFAYPPHLASTVEVWLRLHPAVFAESYPPRQVNNVYFDTIDLQAFDENLAGISRRCKVRFRWYGDSPLPRAGTLELKNKRSMLGWKHSYPIDLDPVLEGDSWRDVRRRLRRMLPSAAHPVFDEHSEATLINRYRRHYFESRDRKLRVTLDSEQTMFDQVHSRGPNVTRRITLPEVHVLELKCESVDYRAATRALRSCPVRGSRFSKYTIGMELR